ncbi:DUF2304 domain-containing protein [Candidatus Saccharibacteria bacterium]|nr:DUF2304 domain-containing protein [Candidatus Saccharibacteria bacterium]
MTTLQIEMAAAAAILFIIIIVSIIRSRLSIRNSIAWLLLPVIFIIIAIFPDPLQSFANWLGFETLSNFIFLVVIALLILICFFLTLSNSKQQEQITKLNQEIAILKQNKKK